MLGPHDPSRLSNEPGERIGPGDPRAGLVSINPARMSGTPVFAGTRVPVQTLFDYLQTGHTLDEFLDDFEGVERERALAVIELARRSVLPDAA